MTVVFKTILGNIKFRLFVDECHDACLNFLKLCQDNFYKGLDFHRIIPGFLIQIGDNTKTGVGGHSAVGESIEVSPTNNFDRAGILAYAETDTVRSQIFITLHAQPELNGKYCGFGLVVEGYNVVQSISRIPTFEDNYPLRPVIITGVEVIESPLT